MADTFRRREQTVQARRYTGSNGVEVRAFLGYPSSPEINPGDRIYVGCDEYAEPGDWVVKSGDRYRVITDWDFTEQYVAVAEVVTNHG